MSDSGSLALTISIFMAVLASLVTGGLGVALWGFLRDRSRRSYDDERHRAILSEFRASAEEQLARVNAELTATEARWRDANHLLLDAQNAQAEKSDAVVANAAGFLSGFGIDPSQIEVDPALIFVLTPFTEDEEQAYGVIKDVCMRNGFNAMRGDEEFLASDILPHIIRNIVRARLIVANVGSRNPNVFYELGIAQALGKATVLVAKTAEDLPFDLRSKRVVTYRNFDELDRKLADALLQALARDVGRERLEGVGAQDVGPKPPPPEAVPEARQATPSELSRRIHISHIDIDTSGLQGGNVLLRIAGFNALDSGISVESLSGFMLMHDPEGDAPLKLGKPNLVSDKFGFVMPMSGFLIEVNQPISPRLAEALQKAVSSDAGLAFDMRHLNIWMRVNGPHVVLRLPLWEAIVARGSLSHLATHGGRYEGEDD